MILSTIRPRRYTAGLLLLVAALLAGLSHPVTAQEQAQQNPKQGPLLVTVNNVAIANEISIRGLTASFPSPVISTISVSDNQANVISGLADSARWLGPAEVAENGESISQLWQPILEYHRDDPGFPPDADLYNQTPAPLFTEIRRSTPFPTSTMLVMDVSGSMIEELEEAKAGNREYIRLLRPVDRVGSIQFCAVIDKVVPISNDKQPVLSAINAADTCDYTAIYDALMLAVEQIKVENYRRAVWVEVSSTQPQRLLTNISSPWPASKEDLS